MPRAPIPEYLRAQIVRRLMVKALAGDGDFYFAYFNREGGMETELFTEEMTARRFLDIADATEKEGKRRNKKPIRRWHDGTRRTRIRSREKDVG
jgi:hypothetical protein